MLRKYFAELDKDESGDLAGAEIAMVSPSVYKVSQTGKMELDELFAVRKYITVPWVLFPLVLGAIFFHTGLSVS